MSRSFRPPILVGSLILRPASPTLAPLAEPTLGLANGEEAEVTAAGVSSWH